MTYHLGIVSEIVRLGQFPKRIAFYETLPHGIDLLFVPAFAFARHGGAKVVHFGFLLALIPLMRSLGKELGLTDVQSSTAAALLFFAPVVGVAGTSAYTDLALVCCVCSGLLLFMRWDREKDSASLVHAAIALGFCYAVKPTFGWAALLGFGFVVWKTRAGWKALVFAGIAFLVVAPWMIRSTVLAQNPFAPFLNSFFPNDWFHPEMDRRLAAQYSALRPSFLWLAAPIDYTVRGGNQGILGAAFLLLPLAMLARGRRWLLGVAGLLLVPWLLNSGTRFLLPAAVPAALALASVLPGRSGIALVVIQAIGAFPPFMGLYQNQSDWRLGPIPVQSALGWEPERDYLRRNIDHFDATELVAERTPPAAKIFALAPLQQAYTGREVLVFWHSALGDDLTSGLVSAQGSLEQQEQATARIRRAGCRYLLIATSDDPFAAIGRGMVDRPQDWHITPVGIAGDEALFLIDRPR